MPTVSQSLADSCLSTRGVSTGSWSTSGAIPSVRQWTRGLEQIIAFATEAVADKCEEYGFEMNVRIVVTDFEEDVLRAVAANHGARLDNIVALLSWGRCFKKVPHMPPNYSVTLANIVGGISNAHAKDNGSPTSPTLPQDVSPFPYARPQFLRLTPDEVQVSADHSSRPILVPRNSTELPWNAGYAEVINAGKTKVNEDQARAEILLVPKHKQSDSTEDIINGEVNEAIKQKELADVIPVHYFAVFDGHAGTGAALMAANILHLIIQDKLLEVRDLLMTQLSDPGSIPASPASELLHQLSPVTPPFSPPPDFNGGDSHTISRTSNEDNDDAQDTSVTAKSATAAEELPTVPSDQASGTSDEPAKDSDDKKEDMVAHTDSEVSVDDDDDATPNQPDLLPSSGITKTRPPTDCIQHPRFNMSIALHRFSIDSLIEGALESSFFDMDGVIARERRIYHVPGGCTAVASIFFMGKLYISNAGDSRAIVLHKDTVIPMSYDFTPETDRQRIQLMAWHHPELLGDLFCPIQFAYRVTRKDIGKRVLHRDGWRKGWSYKTVTEDDVKMPLVLGEGKKARLLGTIGVSRGLGDHDLRVYESDVYVKPFMTCSPEVRILDLNAMDPGENDVLIIGTDGLWDVTSNEKAGSIVKTCLDQFNPDDPNRYVSAAQELVMHARGVSKNGGWRTSEDKLASGDDISVFVIPLNRYQTMLSQSSSTESTNEHS
ncbi:hypothetical protein LSH36_900g00062 [Paralvinella palmiformis]|uniref:PPM-type phosphatase domain-containing protein n=1 Tax=Paralvinella palmiformis TaxID=53620 RepID=A0AAD9MSV3_9ANNE|nr:hypothetical protein LSH36_900g00062 [Paralvinella palmiformis]